jgi:hypothetical protein
LNPNFLGDGCAKQGRPNLGEAHRTTLARPSRKTGARPLSPHATNAGCLPRLAALQGLLAYCRAPLAYFRARLTLLPRPWKRTPEAGQKRGQMCAPGKSVARTHRDMCATLACERTLSHACLGDWEGPWCVESTSDRALIEQAVLGEKRRRQ